MEEKAGEAGTAFLQGVLAISALRRMVKRGEAVVKCVVNVVRRMSSFSGLKLRQFFEVYL
jgi:hypothetical protein